VLIQVTHVMRSTAARSTLILQLLQFKRWKKNHQPMTD